jgi:hypothetical protein
MRITHVAREASEVEARFNLPLLCFHYKITLSSCQTEHCRLSLYVNYYFSFLLLLLRLNRSDPYIVMLSTALTTRWVARMKGPDLVRRICRKDSET